MQRIFLIGYMGAGKTILGSPLAKELGMSFIDLDIFIEKRYHKTINELFHEYGEQEFRLIEQKTLKEVAEFEDIVISTGGGTPCHFDNMDVMNKAGTTIYLEVSTSVLFERLKLGRRKRPILKDKTDNELLSFIEESLSKRVNIYRKCHHQFLVDDLNSVESVTRTAKLIARTINERVKRS
ncbi:shikimate kinase [Bacteroides coprosuis]|uniref:shikimate kinase n=1 Tax=Bacteroides coprosuis TaxID=151276 RepID=UPI001DE5F22D|nr:shikimate kinase [Bacteroides coprosuis]HJD92654.1 shikimate kinase [Bacteroides coprosuis]